MAEFAGPGTGLSMSSFGGAVSRVEMDSFAPRQRVEDLGQIEGGALLDLVTRVANSGGGNTVVAERVFALPGQEADTVHIAPVVETQDGIMTGDVLTVPAADAGIQIHDRGVHIPKAHLANAGEDAVAAARAAVESALQVPAQV